MALEQAAQVVGQGVVDGGFYVTVKAQHAFFVVTFALVVRAVGDVVLQHLRLPAGKHFFTLKVGQCLGLAGPAVAAAPADRTGGHRAHQLRALERTQRAGAPAAQQWGIEQQHAACQIGFAGGRHQAEEAAQRVAHQPGRLPGPLYLGPGEVDQLLHQLAPIVADGVARIVAKALDGAHLEAARLEVAKQHAIGAGAKAVGVGKNKQGHGVRSTFLAAC